MNADGHSGFENAPESRDVGRAGVPQGLKNAPEAFSGSIGRAPVKL